MAKRTRRQRKADREAIRRSVLHLIRIEARRHAELIISKLTDNWLSGNGVKGN